MTKPLMKYVPKKYYSSIRDFYKDSEGYWLCLKADGDYIFENYFSEHTIHENTIRNLTAFATFEEAEEKSKTNRYGIKKE